MRILTEASGSLAAAYLIKAVRDAGHEAIGSDISEYTAANCIADEFIRFPAKDDPALWDKIPQLLKAHRIDLVIPSFDEMMPGWAARQSELARQGTFIAVSPEETIRVCQDKWETYQFFLANGIPTPETALTQDFSLVKPRLGRGGSGVEITNQPVDMRGMISQRPCRGEELTVDTFFDAQGHPVYIIPRRRMGIADGKSTRGVTLSHPLVEQYIHAMASVLRFNGPINFQCFVDGDHVEFLEINPRIAGGMALGFAASENWVPLIVENLLHGKAINPKPIRYDLKMVRYYAECFIP